uniref:Exosome complex component N-terminal domain-containing protein n=1 Tax=Astyanax mexicanus TaxID=7994 RepID=A0A8B9HTE6_ASTMX
GMVPVGLCICERLCSTEDCIPGAGTYLRHGYIFASLAGYVLRRNEGEELPVISVVRETEAQLLIFFTLHYITFGRRFCPKRLTIREIWRTQCIHVPLGNKALGVLEMQWFDWLMLTLRLFCPTGAQMVPISWCEMQCPRTHNKEFRKVARVQPEYLQA